MIDYISMEEKILQGLKKRHKNLVIQIEEDNTIASLEMDFASFYIVCKEDGCINVAACLNTKKYSGAKSKFCLFNPNEVDEDFMDLKDFTNKITTYFDMMLFETEIFPEEPGFRMFSIPPNATEFELKYPGIIWELRYLKSVKYGKELDEWIRLNVIESPKLIHLPIETDGFMNSRFRRELKRSFNKYVPNSKYFKENKDFRMYCYEISPKKTKRFLSEEDRLDFSGTY